MRGLSLSAWAGAARLAAPLLRVMLRRRVRRGKEIGARLPEREGIDPVPRPPGRLVWLHAASMGETQSILPVLQALPPGLTVLVTTGTVTSASMLTERLPQLGLDNVLHRFVPLDVPAWVSRFIDHWRPDVGVFVESELWPNLIGACQARAVPLLLVNARMSERSLRGWQRAPRSAAEILGAFAGVHPQTEQDAERLRSLGAARVGPPGNLKLAASPLPVDEAELSRLQQALGTAPVWLAASTHPDEEEAVAAAHHAMLPRYPDLVTIIAPRHPDRGPSLATALGARRRGAGQGPVPGALWLADTLGEMGLLYRLAAFVFVGGSLVERGGQNPFEAAQFGRPVAMGPHVENNAEPAGRLLRAGALETVADAAALTRWVGTMLDDPPRAAALGAAALREVGCETALPARIAAMILGSIRP